MKLHHSIFLHADTGGEPVKKSPEAKTGHDTLTQ